MRVGVACCGSVACASVVWQGGPVPYDAGLAERLRQRLDGPGVREVAMFGGRSFMVRDQLAVCAASDGTLLLRCDPDEAETLVRRDGARAAEMRGRPMSRGWIRVDISALEDGATLQEWIDVAVAYAEQRANPI